MMFVRADHRPGYIHAPAYLRESSKLDLGVYPHLHRNSHLARKRSNSYNIFIFVLTLLSLGIMVVMLLPLAPQTLDLLRVYDNLVCIIFLIDFTYSLLSTPKKSDYFIKERGWLDLIGSIPSFGISQFGGLLHLHV